MTYVSLHDRLKGPIAQAVGKKLNIKNVHAIPQIEKVVVNVGINKSKMDSKETRAYLGESLMKITGQQPVFTKARMAISNFKTREGMIVGAMVTLRGTQMKLFLDRLLSYAIPRMRDFRGLPTKLDGHGNYAIGLRDHSIFPEVPAPDAKQIFGMQIQITTTAENDEEGMALLKEMGMPFRPDKKKEAAAAAPAAPAPIEDKKEAIDDKEEAKEAEEPKEAPASAKATVGKEEAEESKEASSVAPVGAMDDKEETKEEESVDSSSDDSDTKPPENNSDS